MEQIADAIIRFQNPNHNKGGKTMQKETKDVLLECARLIMHEDPKLYRRLIYAIREDQNLEALKALVDEAEANQRQAWAVGMEC